MTHDSPFVPLTGGCNCGHVRFRLDVAPIITHCCHCRRCQKASGSAFCLNTMIETDAITMLAGAPEPFQGKESMKTAQCPECRLALWTHHPRLGDAIAILGVGALDESERLVPEAHYFTRSKHPWVVIPAGIPAFETLGDAGKAGVGERIGAALARAGAAMPREWAPER